MSTAATEKGKESQAADGLLEGLEDKGKDVSKTDDGLDVKAELAKMRDERIAEKAAAEEREKQLMARLESAEKRIAATGTATTGQLRRRNPEEWEQLFQEGGFVKTMGTYEHEVLEPAILGLHKSYRDEMDETLQIVANNQREHLKRDKNFTDARIKKVDLLLSSLKLKDRAQPGVYQEALNQIVEAEELAELKMNGGHRRQTVRADRGMEHDDLGSPTEEPSRSQMRHMKMFGIKDKKEWDGLSTVEIPV